LVMKNRKLLTLDEGKIFEKMKEIKEDILRRIQGKVS
jgi:uncharacterized spore protein YtfJ